MHGSQAGLIVYNSVQVVARLTTVGRQLGFSCMSVFSEG